VTADRLPGGLDQFGQPIDAFKGITSAREFASISPKPRALALQRVVHLTMQL
jgi:hypothetical protein